ncbi:MAG TPA: DUF5060 domain-containing protein [Acidobacteriaceae bacterium]
MLQLSSLALVGVADPGNVANANRLVATDESQKSVERWEYYEIVLRGPAEGNPFVDVSLSATFKLKNRSVTVGGFYDGEAIYKVRFMPDDLGSWTYTTASNKPELDAKTGVFLCTSPGDRNHGPVSVRDSYHFGYADGTPYVECGTTCYAWAFQAEETQRQTLQTLSASPFNKLRMCIFPKWYQHNRSEPPMYPFPRSADRNDYSRFNVDYFKHLDHLIGELRAIGVQADLILFHPYDKWGYQSMPPEVDDRYLRYVVARYSAFRNVWWSQANEFDLLKSKTNTDWDRLASILQEEDAYGHLRSIHYSHHVYEYGRAWCSHAGVQDAHFEYAASWRADWKKPLVYDECQYEGNIASNWGNIPGDEMTRRFWLATVQGAYAGHGETYLSDRDILWWSHGGVLHGSSPAKIAFLRSMLEETIAKGDGPIGFTAYPSGSTLGAKRENNSVVFYYFDVHAPAEANLPLPEGMSYAAEYIDTLKLTRRSLAGTYSGKAELKLPGTPFGSVWFTALETGKT